MFPVEPNGKRRWRVFVLFEETLKVSSCVVQSHAVMHLLFPRLESGLVRILVEGAVEETVA